MTSIAPVVVASSIRVEEDSFGVIGNCAIKIAFIFACIAPVVVGFGVVWIEAEGFAVVGDSAVEVATVAMLPSAIRLPKTLLASEVALGCLHRRSKN